MILFGEGEIEEIRAGVQRELSELIGFLILVRIVPDPVEVAFSIDERFWRYKPEFDEICARHILRVSKVGYDECNPDRTLGRADSRDDRAGSS
jgi:hypothetical protein